jgi:hypothetical protein
VPAPQLNFLTLTCADVERMAEFLRALGWDESPESEPVHRVFQGTNGIVVGLYGASNYEPHFGPRTDGFRGFTLGLNLAEPDDVDRVYDRLRESRAPRDPEGNVWDVAWKRGSTVAPDGRLTWT